MTKGKRGGASDRATRRERRAQQKRVFFQDDSHDLDTSLKQLGLSTKSISGDGNCLFRALADQYEGDDRHHRTLRHDICAFLRENKETYQFFVEDNREFDDHVSNMEADGCFGGNMELAAFAKLKRVKIKVYQPGMIYVIDGTADEDSGDGNDNDDDSEEPVQILHIAYHSWEHYSSVRNLDGPFTGMPEIKDKTDTLGKSASKGGDNGDNDDEDNADDSKLSSQEKVVLTACPDARLARVRRLLKKHKGNVDKVIDFLYELQAAKDEAAANNAAEAQPIETSAVATDANDATKALATDAEQEGKDVTKTEQSNGANDTVKSSNPRNDVSDHEKKDDLPALVDGSKADDASAAVVADTDTSEHAKKPKRLTARQKKEQARQRRKEQRLEKKRHDASRSKSTEQEGKNATKDDKAMKQLYI
ncbi:hypothetical protein BC940DRAFT_304028 [Gongronella butleri]|nr:hypothetical protein BC940DRAFT_304028 [Gongronella butleri]